MNRSIGLLIFLSLLGIVLSGCGGGNRAPAVAILQPEAGTTLAGKTVSFQAEGRDEDLPPGGELSYSWEFGDGTRGEGARVTHTYREPGSYTVRAIATDDRGSKGEATVTVTVRNAPPRAQLRAAPVGGRAPLSVRLEATGSEDPDGEIREYRWTFGDGTAGSGIEVEHEYPQAGSYEVRLTLTDDDGATASATVTVTVEHAPRLWEVRMLATEDGRVLFDPAVLRIEPGDTVRWVLASGVHTTTAYAPENGRPPALPEGAPPWDSGPLRGAGAAFEFTFPQDAPQGSYPYFCARHESRGMVGLIVVGRFTPIEDALLGSLPGQARSTLEALIRRAEALEPD